MEISSTGQTFVFLMAICFGAALGVVYDVFRVFRVAVPCNRAAVFAQDVFFWLLCAVSSFIFLLYVNTGVVRAFVLLGELVGATLYYVTLGAMVMRSAKLIVGALRRLFRFFGRLIVRPLRALGRLVRAAGKSAAKKAAFLVKKPCKDIETHLQSRMSVVYNYFNRQKKGAASKKRRKRRRKNKRKGKGGRTREKAP